MITPSDPHHSAPDDTERRKLVFELMRKRYARWVDPAVI
jgi:hypothetical protein